MFDAKKLLEMLMNGAQQPQQAPAAQAPQAGGGTLADMLGKALGQGGGQQGGQAGQGGGSRADILGRLGQQSPQQGGSSGASLGGGGLGDILGQILGKGQSAGAAPGQAQDGAAAHGGLEDILRKAQAQLGAGGSLTDILGQVLGQATSGVKEGARRIDDATGASGHMRDAAKQATGQDPNDILEQIKDWVSKNQGGAGAAAGGLGAIVLGTHAGRALAGKALKLGSLALIGGLAYKALQNYQAGRPLLTGADAGQLTEAPRGTGYETAAVTHDSALLYIRAMISAAAADGRIDPKEQEKIFGSLKQAGMDGGAEEFLAKELNSPATVEDLAAGVKTEQEAVQLYTAARIAIDPDDQDNKDYLASLAAAIGMDEKLMAHIDAAARTAG